MSTLIATNGNITNVNTGTIKDTSGTNTAQSIQSNGTVSLPSIPFGRFKITGSNPNIANGNTLPITLQSNAKYVSSPATNNWTVATTGIYRWEGTVRITGSGNYSWLALYDATNSRNHNSSTINGGTFDTSVIPYKLDGTNASGFVTISWSHIYQFVAGDQYSVSVGISSGSGHTLDTTQSEFTVILVG